MKLPKPSNNKFDRLNNEVLQILQKKCKKGKLGGQNWTICKDLECRVFYFEPNKDTIKKWREKQKFYKKGIDRRVIFVAERPGPTPGLIPNDTIVQRIFCVENDSRPGVARKLERCHEVRKKYGLENCYLTNIVKCSKFKGTDKPSKDEINECSKHLIREIEIIKPEVVVAVGGFQYEKLRTEPFKALIGDRLHKITHWAFRGIRGSKETLLERWDREFTELKEKISRSPKFIPIK